MPYPDILSSYIECNKCGKIIEINELVERCPYCKEPIEKRTSEPEDKDYI